MTNSKKSTTTSQVESAPVAAVKETPIAATKPAKPTTKVKALGKIALAKLVMEHGSKFFKVTFMEKNKSKAKNAPAEVPRTMTCRTGVAKYTKAGLAAAAEGKTITGNKKATEAPKTANDLALLGMVTVYEMTGEKGAKKEKSYRTLPLNKITELSIAGGLYKARKS